MQNELKNFNYEKNLVRAALVNEKVWFVLSDIYEIFGFRKVAKYMDSDTLSDLRLVDVDPDEGPQESRFTLISELGLHRALEHYHGQQVRKFTHWIGNEVIPAMKGKTEGVDFTDAPQSSNFSLRIGDNYE